MKRYHYLIICLAIAIASFGCTKPDEDPAELAGVRFQGQYKVIMAVADRQVDVNHDGNASNDILAEIPALANSYLVLRVRTRTDPPRDVFLFEQFWPNQSVRSSANGEVPDEYDPSLVVHYVSQPSVGWFRFENNFTEIEVFRKKPDPERDKQFPLPQEVSIEDNGNIRVLTTRRLYTTSGWEEAEIEVLYERFTSRT